LVGRFKVLSAAGNSVKTALKAKYGARRPPIENSRHDLFDPARIYQWCAAIYRVRAAYIREHHGRKPRLLRPGRFTEKMQWRKLFDLNPIYAVITDKLAVRDFIAERVGAQVLVPLLWIGDDPAAVPFDALDPPYVIKSTHASGHVLLVRKRQDADADTAVATFREWLSACHGIAKDEPAYIPVPRRLMVEQMLLGADGSPPLERRFYVFDGRVRFLQTIFRDEDGLHHRAFHGREWHPLDWYLKTPNQPELCPKPKRYEEMVAIAECLGKGFDHLRVDMYEGDNNIWVGELTLYSWSGLEAFTPDEADSLAGSYWSLQQPTQRAFKAILFEWRYIPQHNGSSPASHLQAADPATADGFTAYRNREAGWR
jgi:TupA-like ATPgrasp